MKLSEAKSAFTASGTELLWSVRHWPGYCGATKDHLGLSLLVESADGKTRSLIIEFPFESKTRTSTPHRQRPKVSEAELASHVEEAIRLGWRPNSRGKPFILHVTPKA